MEKYSFEFKKQIVQEYLEGRGGYTYLSNKYGLSTSTLLKYWVKAYREMGNEGLLRSRKKQKYTFEFKLHVVESYLTTEVSYRELAASVGITNPPMLAKWVNDYRIAGPDALRPKKKGRKPKVAKPTKEQIPQTENEKVEAEYLRQLEEENLKLRIENAYLKELRRLRLENEAKNGKRE